MSQYLRLNAAYTNILMGQLPTSTDVLEMAIATENDPALLPILERVLREYVQIAPVMEVGIRLIVALTNQGKHRESIATCAQLFQICRTEYDHAFLSGMLVQSLGHMGGLWASRIRASERMKGHLRNIDAYTVLDDVRWARLYQAAWKANYL